MKNRKISGDVLNILHDNTKNQDIFRDFVIDLIYQEASHQKNWKFKTCYKQIIDKHIEKWGNDNED